MGDLTHCSRECLGDLDTTGWHILPWDSNTSTSLGSLHRMSHFLSTVSSVRTTMAAWNPLLSIWPHPHGEQRRWQQPQRPQIAPAVRWAIWLASTLRFHGPIHGKKGTTRWLWSHRGRRIDYPPARCILSLRKRNCCGIQRQHTFNSQMPSSTTVKLNEESRDVMLW